MDQKDVSFLDIDLGPHDIQALNDSKAISAFFAQLSYNTNAHIMQSPGNLGITADGIVRAIKSNVLPFPTFIEKKLEVDYKSIIDNGQWAELTNLINLTPIESGVMPHSIAEALITMCRRIQEIEEKRILKNRIERSHLDPASQPIQDAIDAVLFKFYGLSNDEAQYISQRLKEML